MNNFDVGILCRDEAFGNLLEWEVIRLGLSVTREPDKNTPCRLLVIDDRQESPASVMPAEGQVVVIRKNGETIPESMQRNGVTLLYYPFPMAQFKRLLFQGLSEDRPAAEAAAPAEPPALLSLDSKTSTARVAGGAPIHLTASEFSLLDRLTAQNTPLGRKEAATLFGFDENSNLLDVHICHLRSKLEESSHLKLLKTVRGQGYILL